MSESNRNEYYRNYYNSNKDKILSQLLQKVICPYCSRTINHQNLFKHQSTKLCKSRRCSTNDDLQILIKKLQDRLI